MFVSVLVPNYNHSRYLPQRIESILSQTYQDFELIILDDCSTDNSVDVIKRYANNEKVSHIVINEQNSGSTFVQWQRGFGLAKGELIWIAESDDFCTQDFLQTMVDAFKGNNNLAFAYCTSSIVDGDGNPLNRYDAATIIPEGVFEGKLFIKQYMLSGNSVWNASAVVMRKEFAVQADKQYMDYKSAGDHLFWIELAEMGDVYHVTKRMNFFRQHNNKVTPTKVKDGTTYKEENKIYKYLQKSHYVSQKDDFYVRSTYILKILNGAFNSSSTKVELLSLWGYKRWMIKPLLKTVVKIRNYNNR